jgi:hypothetical protein
VLIGGQLKETPSERGGRKAHQLDHKVVGYINDKDMIEKTDVDWGQG